MFDSHICPGTSARMDILDHHKLKSSHFPDIEQALDAADKLVEFQRSQLKGIPEKHPDIVVGHPLLDQFWYAKHQGILVILG